MKEFNVTGTCVPSKHYMVDIVSKLEKIKEMVAKEKYFTINRGRQFGKTTTLSQLRRFLADEYVVVSISFEGLGETAFESEEEFCFVFIQQIYERLAFSSVTEEYRKGWNDISVKTFKGLSRLITKMCKEKKVVLLVDEVDKASNHVIFMNFLSKLRDKYLARADELDYTFHSVILAGVYDIKNLKFKMIQDGNRAPKIRETTVYNSPWNIAADFKVDMSFDITEIQGMLNSFELDAKTGMDTLMMAKEIYAYTSGYPVLVSQICKNINEELGNNWTTGGVRHSVKLILNEKSPLFETLIKNLNANKDLNKLLSHMVLNRTNWSYNPDNEHIDIGLVYGYLKVSEGKVEIANRIFETRLLNYFTSKKLDEQLHQVDNPVVDETGIIENGKFNMARCLEKFAQYYERYYNEKDEKFIEREGRMLFLMFLSPVLNGKGFAYIEAQTIEGKRTDVVINYLDAQYIVELKIWNGQKKHEDAVCQLLGYMDKFETTEGYLLTFNFNKNKTSTSEWVDVDEKRRIFNVVI